MEWNKRYTHFFTVKISNEHDSILLWPKNEFEQIPNYIHAVKPFILQFVLYSNGERNYTIFWSIFSLNTKQLILAFAHFKISQNSYCIQPFHIHSTIIFFVILYVCNWVASMWTMFMFFYPHFNFSARLYAIRKSGRLIFRQLQALFLLKKVSLMVC